MKLRPFDNSLNEDYSMYDKLPYVKDLDICGPDKIAMESGNVIKFFRCNISDTYQITGIDDLYYEKLQQHEKDKKKAEAEKEKNALKRLADTLLPKEEFETVENPQPAENIPDSEKARQPEETLAAKPSDNQASFSGDTWGTLEEW